MEPLMSPEILLQALQAGKPKDKLNVDTTSIAYALYARKSTQGDEKQERSIGDQISECVEKVMRPNNIRPVKVIEEKYSAKEPDTRVKFKELISDIKAGRITGLIAWHPDRLARNMKDAGEIIDMLDKSIIKDLHFASFSFENTPSGLMHLGITFVIAKQYSDQLSKNVSRGIEHAIEDGEHINRPKHGYYKDGQQHLRPDGRNFDLIKRAFQLRLEHKTFGEIA